MSNLIHSLRYVGVAILLGCGLAVQGWAAISVVNAPAPTPAATGTTTGISASATVSPGANVLVVWLATRGASTAYSDPATLAWNGQTLNRVATATDGVSTFRNVSLYALFNPTPGTALVNGTGAAGTSFWAIKSFSLSGVDTNVSPLIGSAGGSSGTTLLSFDIASCPAGGLAAVCANWSTVSDPISFTGTGGTPVTTSEFFSAASGNNIGMGYIMGVSAGTDTFTASLGGTGNKSAFAAAVFTPWAGVTEPPTNTPPVITQVGLSGAGLEMSGTNGLPNAFYQVLTSTDLELPGSAWDAVATNTFDPTGQFSQTVPVVDGGTGFYRLRVPGGGAPPFITSAPQPQTVNAGQNATFNVTATGTAPLGYQWFFGSTPLFAGVPGPMLTLTNVQSGDAGLYSLAVSNSFGLATSPGALLTVLSNSANQGLMGWATVSNYGIATTTGGAGGATVTVSNITALNTYATASSPYIIYVSGNLSGTFSISSNKTIIGLPGASISNCSISITRGPNIILRNLKLVGKNCSDCSTCDGCGSDVITVEGANVHHLWLDHLDISDGSDGNLDFTTQADYATVSWCKFSYSTPGRGHRLSNLISGADTSTGDRGRLKITYAYCWWSDNVDSRMPRGRFGQIHMINCYWNAPGNQSCVNSGNEMQARVENGYFQNVNNPLLISTNTGAIAASGNLFVNCTGTQNVGGTVFTPPYPYTLDPAASVPAIVQAGAGPQ